MSRYVRLMSDQMRKAMGGESSPGKPNLWHRLRKFFIHPMRLEIEYERDLLNVDAERQNFFKQLTICRQQLNRARLRIQFYEQKLSHKYVRCEGCAAENCVEMEGIWLVPNRDITGYVERRYAYVACESCETDVRRRHYMKEFNESS